MSLSGPIAGAVASIDDLELRRDVERVLVRGQGAMTAMGQLRLPQNDVETVADAEDTHYDYLAPKVGVVLLELNRLLYEAFQLFPRLDKANDGSTDDIDFEFDLVDDDSSSSDASVETAVARISNTDTSNADLRTALGDVVVALGGMLQSRVNRLGDRIEFALSAEDSWTLLRELDDYWHKLNKGLQALVLGFIGVFCKTPREELLPEYRSQLEASIAVRRAVTHLSLHIDKFNRVVGTKSGKELKPYLMAIADQLHRYCLTREYRDMRAEDKHAVIDFRREIHSIRSPGGDPPTLRVRQAVEGFSKYLQSLDVINQREVLIIHDKGLLANVVHRLRGIEPDVATRPAVAAPSLQQVLQDMHNIEGRDPSLDEILRSNAEADLSGWAEEAVRSLYAQLTAQVQAVLGRI